MRSTVRSCRTRSSLACSEARHLADLIEEHRAAVGRFELAGVRFAAPVKAPFS